MLLLVQKGTAGDLQSCSMQHLEQLLTLATCMTVCEPHYKLCTLAERVRVAYGLMLLPVRLWIVFKVLCRIIPRYNATNPVNT